MYYSTGDLLRVDEEGFLYFVDRTGDTYRWKVSKSGHLVISRLRVRLSSHKALDERSVFLFGHANSLQPTYSFVSRKEVFSKAQ